MKRCKIIGLTGQSGSGKSTAAQAFERCGFRVINADLLVAGLYESGSVCLIALSAVFGKDIINSDASLNRPLLAQRAFSSAENTALLGKIVHPFVTAELFKALKETSGAVVLDAPQLFESNLDVICDYIVSVVADRPTRLQRICARDKITEKQATERMNAQYDEQFFRVHSDYILENNAALESLASQAQELAAVLKAEVG